MRRNDWKLGLAAVLSASVLAAGCSDDDGRDGSPDGDGTTVDAGDTPTGSVDAGTPTMDAAADSADGSATSGDASINPDFPALPAVLSLSGCESLDVPALCTLAQNGGTFSANCAGAKYTGTVTKDRAVTLTAPEVTETDGAKVALACTGKLENAGYLTLDCTQTVTPLADAGAPTQATCKMRSDSQILPGVACLELPAQIDGVSVCTEGAAMGGTTIAAGACKIAQDGCNFLAECADDVTLSGTVDATGVRFTQGLKALADAYTPMSGSPAFMKGAEAAHTCTGTVAEGKLTGSCTAGGGRGVMPTSVCALGGTYTAPATCANIGPSAEQLFVLDSCDALKNGEGQNPGIGEPVCALRQNNCIWDVQCGQDPLTKFAGRLPAGARKIEWRLATGTPCELSVDATGAVSGKCTVPGQAACELKSKPAVPGGADCPILPGGTNVTSHGCGGGDPLDCRATLQHQCNYMALCTFTPTNDLVVAGTTSTENGRPKFDFNGLGAYSCSVTKASAEEIASGDRIEYEWYGQCVTPAGGMCRDNYDPVAKTGFRGLRLYFDVPEGVTVPPPAAPATP